MKDFFEALLGRYGLPTVAMAIVFAAAVWALAHWTAASGAPVSVVWGLVGYTKPDPTTPASSPPPPVVPAATVSTVAELPNAARGPLVTLKDISVFDLRSWVPVEKAGAGRVSPANYINYLHVRKTADADTFVAHYGTGGYAIDLRCITHAYNIVRKAPSAEHVNEQEYAIEVDVSQEPIGTEFLIVVEATYWNGFRNLAQETASTYTDDEIDALGELALVVLFPPSKPFKQVRRFEGAAASRAPYRGIDSFYEDVNRGFVYWSIRQRRPDRHYTLEWDW